MVEKENGATIEDKRFLWYGFGIAEERDAGGAATKRYFGGGVQQGGSNYLFTPDHLGTVREMTDTAGAARARYDLDPYGRRTKTAGDLDTDLGFTSTTAHGASGLSLAVFRAYDPDRARWLNEDPIGLDGGLNLYAYVDGDPINQVDPLGLWSQWHQMAAPIVPGLWLWHPTVVQSNFMGSWGVAWASNTAAGFGHNLTGGLTTALNQAMGNPINRCDQAFTAGQRIGVVISVAMWLTGMGKVGTAGSMRASNFNFRNLLSHAGNAKNKPWGQFAKTFWGGGAGTRNMHHWSIPAALFKNAPPWLRHAFQGGWNNVPVSGRWNQAIGSMQRSGGLNGWIGWGIHWSFAGGYAGGLSAPLTHALSGGGCP